MAVITISRQYGSDDASIASRVCDLLGYRFFDRAIMERVAAEEHLSESEIVDFSEDHHEARSFLDRLLRSPQAVAQTRVWKEDTKGVRGVDVVTFDAANSIKMVQVVVKAAYRQGNIVIVGRAGQVILQAMPDVLHVRLEAPLDVRCQRVATSENISVEAARDRVIRRDKAAADYVKRFYAVDWTDPLLYHLVINTGRWNAEAAALLIVGAVDQLHALEQHVGAAKEATP